MEGWHTVSIQHTSETWLDFFKRWQFDPHQTTVNQVLDFLHTLHELILSYSAIETIRSAISAIIKIAEVPPPRETLVSVLIFKRNLSPETSTTKIHQDMGGQQGFP